MVALAVCASAGNASAVYPGVPSIYVNYNPNCTFSMTADGGYTIAPGSVATLPPGQYQVLVSMPNPASGYTCATPNFSLSGPGVNLQTVFPNQATDTDLLTTLAPSSTYVAEDANAPGATAVSFATSATGSSTSLLPAQARPSVPSTRSVQPDLVGSDASSARGTLRATVSKAGKVALTVGGRKVVSLQAGRYTITVEDAAARAGFFLRRGSAKPIDLARPGFVGRRTETITLTAGAWSFFAQAGDPSRFSVVG